MRKTWLDIAKGIAILLVCVGHSRVVENDYAASWIYSFHMPIFFMAAGYCFDPGKVRNYGAYLVRKLQVLAYPYFMLSILGGVLAALLYAGIGFNGVIKYLTKAVYPYPGNFMIGFWFVRVLFFVEIVFAFFKGRYLSYLVLLCAILGFSQNELIVDTDIMAFLRAMVLYYIGFSLRGLELPNSCMKASALGMGLFVVHGVILHLNGFPVFHTGDLLGVQHPVSYVSLGVIGSLMVCFCSVVVEKIPYVGKPLAWLGRYSILLLTVHPICGVARASWVNVWGMNAMGSVVVELLLIAVLMYLLSGPLNFFMRIPKWRKNG